jgi:hypothetical protein
MSDNVPQELTPQYLKQALKAFKKRLKLTRLDEESSLGGGPFSKGGDSGIFAIQAPNQYPRTVWDKLVEQGKLRHAGSGLYELVEDPNTPRDRE